MRFFFELLPWIGCPTWVKIDGVISFCIYILPKFSRFRIYRIPKQKYNANGFIFTFKLSWLFFTHLDFTLRIAK